MRAHYKIILIALTFCSCGHDEPVIPEVATATEDNVYIEMNRWIYGEMNRQYLWREDLPDSLDCDYNLAPRDFYESLLSPKDRFSYFTTNSNYNPDSESSHDYGFAYQTVADRVGNQALEILYVKSPEVRRLGLRRGDFVRLHGEAGGNCVIERVELVDGVFKGTSQHLSVPVPRSINSTVLLDTVYCEGDDRIGYLCYLEFEDVEDLVTPLAKFAENNITDLILDLRYNPGGLVSTCRFLSNCIVTPNGYDRIFQKSSYNSILGAEYYRSTGDSMTYSYFAAPVTIPGEYLGRAITPLNLKRLYVLTSGHTASASEATVMCLRSYMPVVVIGETTVGKGVGSRNISDSRFRYSLQPIIFRYYNADGISTPDSGIEPDVYIADGYKTGKLEIGDRDELLLSAALAILRGENPLTGKSMSMAENNPDYTLTPIGEPSFVTQFNNKHYNEKF